MIILCQPRSSRPEVFCKNWVLRNFAKFTRKHLCQSLVLNKVAGLRPATLLKKRLWHRWFEFLSFWVLNFEFPVSFGKFLITPFFIEYLWWLLLSTHILPTFLLISTISTSIEKKREECFFSKILISLSLILFLF